MGDNEPMSNASPSTADVPGLTWTAGAVARMLAVPPSTLRAWHRRYDIPPTADGDGQHRRYSAAEVTALLRMKHLIADGVGARSAAELAFHPSAIGAVARPQDIVAAGLRLDTAALAATLDHHFAVDGVVDTWQRLCCPALNLLGGQDAEDVEHCADVVHLLSWAITAALHRVTATGDHTSHGRPAVLLACTEGERHVLPLDVLRTALSQRGVPALLLGTEVPDPALRDAVRRAEPTPAALVLWAHSPETARTALTRSRVRGTTTRLVLAGPGWSARQGHRLATLPDAIELLAS